MQGAADPSAAANLAQHCAQSVRSLQPCKGWGPEQQGMHEGLVGMQACEAVGGLWQGPKHDSTRQCTSKESCLQPTAIPIL